MYTNLKKQLMTRYPWSCFSGCLHKTEETFGVAALLQHCNASTGVRGWNRLYKRKPLTLAQVDWLHIGFLRDISDSGLHWRKFTSKTSLNTGFAWVMLRTATLNMLSLLKHYLLWTGNNNLAYHLIRFGFLTNILEECRIIILGVVNMMLRLANIMWAAKKNTTCIPFLEGPDSIYCTYFLTSLAAEYFTVQVQ